jgi:signal peptidase I
LPLKDILAGKEKLHRWQARAMRRRRHKRNRLLGWLSWIVLVIVILPILFILASYGSGWRFNIVSGKSMEPTYYAGGLVITQPVAPETVKIGDVIVFRVTAGDVMGFICHRVVEINTVDNELFFQTQGDNNEYPDMELVPAKDLAGKKALYVPKVGKVTYYYRGTITLRGRSVLAGPLFIALVGLIIVGVESSNIYDWLFARRAMKRIERLKKLRRR